MGSAALSYPTLKLQNLIQEKELSHSGDRDHWYGKIQLQAFEALKEAGFPDRRHESWKYLYLEPLLSPQLSFFTQDHRKEVLESSDSENMVLRNGLSAASFTGQSKKGWRSLGSEIQNENSQLRHWPWHDLLSVENPFALLNAAMAPDGAYYHLKAGSKPATPLTLKLVFDAGMLSQPRVFLDIEEDAQVTVILETEALGDALSFQNSVIHARLGKRAKLQMRCLERGSQHSWHFEQHYLWLGEGSIFNRVGFAHGGAISRQETQVFFQGPNASVDLNQLAILDGYSRRYQHSIFHHEAKECRSRQVFRNFLGDQSQMETNSLVHVGRGAVKSDSNQQIRNLLLGPDVRAFSRPQLKIYADDVKCSHGSATGELEEDELFYLQSRGLHRDFARYLMIYGLAEELIQKIEHKNLRDLLEKQVTEKLQALCRS